MDTNEFKPENELKPAQVVPFSPFEQVLSAVIVIPLPIFAFICAEVMKPEWQSGKISDYALLLLNPQAALLFFPLLVYPALSLVLFLIHPVRYGSMLIIRFGIYTGVLLALQYVVLAAIYLPVSIGAGAYFVISYLLAKRFRAKWSIFLITGIGLAAYLLILALMSGFSWDLLSEPSYLATEFPIAFLISMIAASPLLCFFVMLAFALRLFKSYDAGVIPTPRVFILPGAWLAGFAGAWAYSVYQMLQLYAALPTSPPDCYVATAAAKGHPGLVGSHPVRLPGGTLWVNAQLQTLKAAELVILSLAPGFHQALRAAYDRVGPLLARRLTHPFLADLAYFSLKPAEWLSRRVMDRLFPQWKEFAARLYH